MMKNKFNVLLLIIFSYFLTGCAGSKMTEIPLVKKVDIAKFIFHHIVYIDYLSL